MKKKLSVSLLLAMLATSALAEPQRPPEDDEGTVLPAAIAKRFGLDGYECRVALPNPQGNVPRVARTAARMSVWVADQKPIDGESPRVYLHREGDGRVFLRGPAFNAVNMGELGDLIIRNREEDGPDKPMGIDHSNFVHWVPLGNLGEMRARIKEYQDGLGDLGMIEKASFSVHHARQYPPKGLKKGELKEGQYDVTVLLAKFAGRVRVFGLCM